MLKIITDSASDITLAQAKELNVDMISLNVTFEGKTYKEEKDIQFSGTFFCENELQKQKRIDEVIEQIKEK